MKANDSGENEAGLEQSTAPDQEVSSELGDTDQEVSLGVPGVETGGLEAGFAGFIDAAPGVTPGKTKLSLKIILIFMLVIIIPMIISTDLVTREVSSRSEQERLRSLKDAAAIARKYVVSNSETHLIMATRLSEDQELRKYIKNQEGESLEALLRLELKRKNLDVVEVQDISGRRLVRITSEKFFNDYEVSKNLFVKGLKKIPDSEFVIRRDRATERFECFLESCVHIEQYGQDLKLLFLVKRLPADFFDGLKDLTNLHISILQGTFRVLTTIFGDDGKRMSETEIDPEIVREINDKGLSIKSGERFLGESYYSIYEKFQPTGSREVYVCASIDKKTFLETNYILVFYLKIITVVSIILAMIAGFFLSHNIVTPIKRLVTGARAIGSGELATRIEVRESDEIGVLAQEFNRMAVNLKASYDRLDRKMYEISTLYSVSNSINFQSDSEQILNVIMDKTIGALYAERGSLMLLNDDTDELEIKVVRGFKGEIRKRIGLKSGEGIAGTVYKNGSGVMVNKGFRDDRFKEFEEFIEDTKNIRSMICVPLKVKDRTLGVMNVVNRVSHGATFSEDDLNLANALATHAAMAIENAKLYELSITDGMTKLFIHRFFQIRLGEEIMRARRYGSRLSLIMFDIDHFKKFNDTYGHQTGDDVLIGVAGILKKAVRQDVDVAARYGGEEFTVIAPETDGPDAMIVAERIRKAVEAAEFPGPEGAILKVKVSLGIATFPIHAKEKMELIRKADTALYFSKENGRNQSTMYSDNMGEVSEK